MTAPKVTVTEHGPYLISGDLPVVRRHIVESEHGEPMTWQTVSTEEGSRALCRCGSSAAKPFCDGTHKAVRFDGTPAPVPDAGYHDRAKVYETVGLVVRDDRALCVHAGFCGTRLTNVWKLVGGAGTEDSVDRAQVINMVERCPSGALTYRMAPDEPDIEPDLRAEAGIVANGPIFLSGGVPVELPDGTVLEVRNRQTLCRCGQSSRKPFCDGTHKEVGFLDG